MSTNVPVVTISYNRLKSILNDPHAATQFNLRSRDLAEVLAAGVTIQPAPTDTRSASVIRTLERQLADTQHNLDVTVALLEKAAPTDTLREAARFAKAITEYGVHHGDCPYDLWNKSFSRCKCGLFRLVKDAEKLLARAALDTTKEAERG
jgi:hypothetical protein